MESTQALLWQPNIHGNPSTVPAQGCRSLAPCTMLVGVYVCWERFLRTARKGQLALVYTVKEIFASKCTNPPIFTQLVNQQPELVDLALILGLE